MSFGSLSFAFLVLTVSSQGFAYDNVYVGNLSSEVAYELRFIKKGGLQGLKPNCSDLQDPPVNFLLFNRDNPNTPVPINPSNPVEINPRKKVVLIIPGWLQNYDFSGIKKLRAAYLERYDLNLVLVDWSSLSSKPYTTGFCHVKLMGDKVGDFLCKLPDIGVRLQTVHVVGHCIGGQIAGYAGKRLISSCNGQKVGRITGVDPAGPLFNYKTADVRLDKKDADLVDAIHTDGFSFGYYYACGHADFFPNCGISQPGCPYVGREFDDNTLVSDVLCFHSRSLELMAESVNSEDLIGVTCTMCPNRCRPAIITEQYVVMGENLRSKPSHDKFLLPTNKVPPYGRGMDPYFAKVRKGISDFFKNCTKES